MTDQQKPLATAGEDHPYRVRKCRHGTMLYNTNDRYIGEAFHRYGEYGERELQMLLQALRSGDVVVEAGANIGALAIPMATRIGPTGRLHAYEPQRLTYQLLTANVALNGLANVHTHRAALGREPGKIAVPVLDPQAVENFGGLSLVGSTVGEPVPVETIDGLGLERCRLIKADVQGMELDVLLGAVETIKRCRPILYVENELPGMKGELTDWIHGQGYRTWMHTPPLFNPDNYLKIADNIYPSIVSGNMLCIPREIKVDVDLPEITEAAPTYARSTASTI